MKYVTALFAVLSFYVLILVSVLQFSSMKTLRMRSSSMQHVGSFVGPNRRTLFRRCNKDASERVLPEYPYTRGSENLPKKMQKKCVQASWGCLQYHNRTFFPTSAKDMNFLQLNTIRIILPTLEGP